MGVSSQGDINVNTGTVSLNGAGIAIASTSSPGTTLHTTDSGEAFFDSIEVEFHNINTTTSRVLTVLWGGTAAKDKRIYTIRPMSSVLVAGRLNNSLSVSAFADIANEVNAFVSIDKYLNDNP